jgi:hypothetical protein
MSLHLPPRAFRDNYRWMGNPEPADASTVAPRTIPVRSVHQALMATRVPLT